MEMLKQEILGLLDSGESAEEIKREVDRIIREWACWKNSELNNIPREFFFNKEFEITTYSWQVDEAHLRGRYVVLIDGLNDKDYFFCKNLETGEEIIVSKTALIYFMTIPDQDLESVYVGCLSNMGDYHYLAVKHDD